MKPINDMTQGEFAALIQSRLQEKGINVVLSGGGAVSIYSDNKYVSRDLDLVNIYFAKRSIIRGVMDEIGFREIGRHFEHPNTEFFVEFPPVPLSVGEEPVGKIIEQEYETGTLRVISPTDCVKDRLSLIIIGEINSAWHRQY